MVLDYPTLFTVTMFVSAVAGMLLLFAWVQNRSTVALGLWGAAYLLSTVAMTLLVANRAALDAWPAMVAYPLWIAAHGMMWHAARNFEGRRTPLAFTLAGVVLWLGACQVEGFYASHAARIMLLSAIIGAYLLLCVSEIWRAQDRELMSRWPAMVLLGVHAAFFLARVPLANVVPFPGGVLPPSPDWLPVGVFETLFHTFAMCVLLMNMAKERAELRQRQYSLIDPLTGVANRRAFFERGERLLGRTRADRQTATLLLFDLDRFKQINDTFGHQVGDRVLSAFCDVAQSMLRPGDLFSRHGGEEFACLLVDASFSESVRIAERIRGGFGRASLDLGKANPAVTVSVGIAMAGEGEQELEQLVAVADRALYRAKAKGRNRVEAARAPLQVVETIGAVAS
ncbi:MAG: hypothetical protein QOC56_1151 [Alphaproteobacteria bacterium]|nr:hypothetical protein [Alphaproteobacteria bacterium]